jgi:hypothetical protein
MARQSRSGVPCRGPLDKFRLSPGMTLTRSRRPGDTILYRDHRAERDTPLAELDWTGTDWADCKRLNSVAAYVACIEINMRVHEGRKRARVWPPNGSAHIEAPLLPDGSPRFSDDTVLSLC